MLKKMVFVIIATSLPMFLLGELSAKQEIGSDELKPFYESIIDEMTAKCKYKTNMRNSRCEKIKIASTISCLKCNYWNNNREKLVEEMCKQNFGRNRDRALVYLNGRFHRIAKERGFNLHSQTPLEALPEKPVNGFEKMTINEFCRYYCIPAGLVLSSFGDKGVAAKKNVSIGQIAEDKDMRVEEIYRMVKQK